MATRRVLITGANKGIGFAIARRVLLDHADTQVILACRSRERGEGALAALANEDGSFRERAVVLEMDTSSDASVAAAAETYSREHGGGESGSVGVGGGALYAICNNAGIAAGAPVDLLNVNVRGPKRVCEAFLPFLQEGGRVVNISSGAAPGCVARSRPERRAFFTNTNVTWEEIETVLAEVEAMPRGVKDLKAAGIGNVNGAYGLSKALLNCYTMLLARTHGAAVRVNSCSPGMIKTDIFSDFKPWFVPSFLFDIIVKFMGAKTPDEGALAPSRLLFGDLRGNGRYYGSDGLRSPLDASRNPGDPEYDPDEELAGTGGGGAAAASDSSSSSSPPAPSSSSSL